MPPSTDATALNDLLTSTLSLLSQFTHSLTLSSTATSHTTTSIANPPNPLLVLSDSAKLLKAHTTKLSLLVLTKPFTPTAIAKVLRELAGTCLPAMMSGVQICCESPEREKWGAMMADETRQRVRSVFREYEILLKEVQALASAGAGGANVGRRDSLSSTGVVWEACDALVELQRLGIGGLAVKKAKQYRETLQDAIKELREWKDGEDLEFEGRGDSLADSDDEGVDGDKDSIEDIFNAANSLPKDRPELKVLVEDAEGKLKKIALLFAALLKRRIEAFKITEDGVEELKRAVTRLDDLMMHLRRIPHQIDALVGSFYDLEEDAAKLGLDKVVTEAQAASEGMLLGWSGQEDEFTTWLRKWTAAIGD